MAIKPELVTLTPLATAREADLTEVAVHLHPVDEVAVARVPLAPGLRLRTPEGVVRVARLIPSGHKVALRPVALGDAVHKYGQVIGFAAAPIAPGDHVHSHNLGVGALTHDYAVGVDVKPVDVVPKAARRTFMGFRRPDGRVGTRNYVAIVSTVNCSASTVRAIADHFRPGAPGGDILRDYPTVDGVIGLTHKGGCGARYGSREIDLLQRTLAGVARHPNVGAYALVGLGCEINQITDLVNAQGLDGDRPPLLVIQDEGGLLETVEAGLRIGRSLAVWRLRRLERGDGQPGAGARRRPDRAPGRDRRAWRDARGLWRGAHADAARRLTRGRGAPARAHPLVGGIHAAQRLRDRQQPLAGQ